MGDSSAAIRHIVAFRERPMRDDAARKATTRSLVELSNALEASGLLSPEQRSHLSQLAASATDGRGLAQRLVQRGWLTAWQARQLLAGRGQFFLGKYKLLERLGAGGMGTVYRAEQPGLGRIVAIKTIAKTSLKRRGAAERFLREIRAAAQLNHPHIVAAYDADRVGSRYFLVMEHVAGRSLEQVAREHGPLPIGAACRWIAQAALGLQHAFEKGLVHRDIKPGNLIVAEGDPPAADRAGGDPQVGLARPGERTGRSLFNCPIKILDFGLARFTSEEFTEAEALTRTGQVMGTPDYIAPEQARSTKSADVRADIFSLGCTLFRLLTGRVPFGGTSTMEKLAARFTEIAPPLRTFRPDAPAALEQILARMLAPEPEQRYRQPAEVAEVLAPFVGATDQPSQTELADTIDAFAPTVIDAGSAVPVAGPADLQGPSPVPAPGADTSAPAFLPLDSDEDAESPLEPEHDADLDEFFHEVTVAAESQSQTFGRRAVERFDPKPLVWTLAGTALVAMAVLGYFVWERTGRTLLTLEIPADLRQGLAVFVDGAQVPTPKLEPIQLRTSWGRHMLLVRREGYEPIEVRLDLDRGERRVFVFDWKPLPETVRKAELAALAARVAAFCSQHSKRPPANKDSQQPPGAAELSPAELEKLVHAPETVQLRRDLVDFRRRHYAHPDVTIPAARLMRRLPWPVDLLRRDRIDPYELKTASQQSRDAGVAAPTPLPELVAILGDSRLMHWGVVRSLSFSPDGKLLASGAEDGTIKLWDPNTGREQLKLRYGYSGAAFCTNTKLLAYGSSAQPAALWDIAKRKQIQMFEGLIGYVPDVSFSPDGKRLASVSGQEIFLWDASTGKHLYTLKGHAQQVLTLAYCPDGKTLASAGHDNVIRLWDPETGKEQGHLEGHSKDVKSVCFSHDGKFLASAAMDHTVVLWEHSNERAVGKFNYSAPWSVAFSPDAKILASVNDGGTIKLWDVYTKQELRTIQAHGGPAYFVIFSPDGKTLASGGSDPNVKLWDVATGQQRIKTSGHQGPVNSMAVSPDGSRLASGSADRTVRIWNLASGKEERAIQGHGIVAFSPDGQALASATGGELLLWPNTSAETPTKVFERRANFGVYQLVFSPGGESLATAEGSGGVNIWNVNTGQKRLVLAIAKPTVLSVAFSPDGRVLATGSGDAPEQLWDADTGRELQTFGSASDGAGSVAFSPDGQWLAATRSPARFEANKIYLWSLTEGRARQLSEAHATYVYSVGFDPAGDSLVSCGDDGAVRLWDPRYGTLQETIQLGPPSGVIRQVAFTPDGRHVVTANANGTIYVLRLKEWTQAESDEDKKRP